MLNKPNTCPFCCEDELIIQKGRYVLVLGKDFDPTTISVPDATWKLCRACSEEIIPHKLYTQLEEKREGVKILD